jgi:hypothetical protein
MKLFLSALAALVLGAAVMSTDAAAQPRCWWNGLIAATTIMAGITVGTTTDIGMRGVGRTTDDPVRQISARLRASRACIRWSPARPTAPNSDKAHLIAFGWFCSPGSGFA